MCGSFIPSAMSPAPKAEVFKNPKIGGPHKKASTCKHFYFVFDRSDRYLTDEGFKVIMTSELQMSIIQRYTYI